MHEWHHHASTTISQPHVVWRKLNWRRLAGMHSKIHKKVFEEIYIHLIAA